MAMLVIDIPSGYKMEQPTADQIVKSGQVPEMRDADVLKSGKTIWYFDHIPNVTRCFQHTVSWNSRRFKVNGKQIKKILLFIGSFAIFSF